MVIVFFLLCAMSLYFWFDRTSARSQIATKEAEKQELTSEIDETKEERLELSYILNRGKEIAELEAKSVTYDKLLTIIAQVSPEKLLISSLNFKTTGEINLAGRAATRDDIAAFTERLSQSTSFRNVTLNQTDSQSDGVHYSVTMSTVGVAPKSSPTPTGAN